MNKHLLTTKYYISHLTLARHRNGHGIHSPFVYDFVTKVLFSRKDFGDYVRIAEIRNYLTGLSDLLQVRDMGSASGIFSTQERQVSSMLKHSSVSLKFGKLLYRIAEYYKPPGIVELGTSIGFSTCCLALGNPDARLVTMEGNSSLGSFSTGLFKKYGLHGIKSKTGMFDDLLLSLRDEVPQPGLVFIDGNHNYSPTMRYYEFFTGIMDKGCIIIDDIHWSGNMHKAWKRIVSDRRAVVTIDLFHAGLIFMDQSLTPGHYTIRF